MLQGLREQVLEANLELVRRGLVLYTFGNASGISREEGLVVIKPSGVPYKNLRPDHLVVTDLTGKVVEGNLRPSSDLPTHLVLYNQFPEIGGVAHTHSEYATAWAQARQADSMFWHHSRGLFSRRGARYVPRCPIGNCRGLRGEYWPRHRPQLATDQSGVDSRRAGGQSRAFRVGKERRRLLITRLFSSRSREWHISPSASMPRRTRSEAHYTTNITFGNMERTHITDRQRINDK